MPRVSDVVADPQKIKDVIAARGMELDVDRIVELDGERRRLTQNVDALRSEIKKLAKSFGAAGGARKHGRSSGRSADESGDGNEAAEDLRVRAQELREQEKDLSSELKEVTDELSELTDWLPNWLDERVPVGGEDAVEMVKTWGEPKQFGFEPRHAHELGIDLGLIDTVGAVKAARSRFYALLDDAVLLRNALVQLFLQHVRPQGFTLVSPPVVAKPATLRASGYLPFQGVDNFALRDEDLSLVGTSEQTLLGMHIDHTFDSLPAPFLGDSMCFRTESGSYGKDTAGIIRSHQFYKLEQFIFCHPGESELWFQQALENEEWMLQALDIPYQVINTPSGDLGAPAAIKYDTEAWFPAQGKYRELTSNSNLLDFQTTRGHIRYKIGSGKDADKGNPHTISATAFTDRLILALFENHQQADGSVVLPEVLSPWLPRLHLTR